MGDPGGLRNVGKAEAAVVAVQGGILLAKVGDGDGEQALVLVVVQRHTHVGLFAVVEVHGDTGIEGDIGKVAAAVIAVEIVGKGLPESFVYTRARPGFRAGNACSISKAQTHKSLGLAE
jgi:hypothetical protein